MYLAIDIGATKTLIAVFSARGKVMRKTKFYTPQGSRSFINSLTDALGPLQKYAISVVVVAIPGTVHKNYSVHFGNRKWDDIDIYTPIKNLFNCQIYFENDANLAAIYEGHRLKGRTVFLTFSTGLGGGIVENGQLLPEFKDFEPGRHPYWYDGELQRWEQIASARAIGNFYHVDHASSLRHGEQMKDVARRLYLGIPDIIRKYHPDNIVLGGPMGKIFRRFVRYMPKAQARYLRPKRPTESVIYGCYLYAKQREKR